jgi:precorrin-8X/cobalt-precorrin-8 methylmutase
MNDMRQMTALGRNIEEESFSIVDREAGDHGFSPEAWQVVRRAIHATADFELKTLMQLTPDAIDAGVIALRRGAPLILDVKMIQVGVSEERLAAYGVEAHCFISDDDVIAEAKAKESTRAIEAMRKAARLGLLQDAIVAIGNAPTALLEVVRLAREEGIAPALVIGVPVGFVSAAESKALLLESGLPSIVLRGRKGGSPIAVAILHALLRISAERGA